MTEVKRPVIDGILNLNKPQGMTSFQLVAFVRRLSGERKVGHSGTLDPDAIGVLPILLGRATKLSRFLLESSKTYRAEIEFGRTTSTYDSSGITLEQHDTSLLTIGHIEESLKSFRGTIEQIPPMYSAIKHKGKALYQLARAGIEVPRKPRQVSVLRLDVLDWRNPTLIIDVECSKGTYIRSLAHDLGKALGCGAYLKRLSRLQSGPFRIEESLTTTQLENAFQSGHWRPLVHPPDTILGHLKAAIVDAEVENAIAHGRSFVLDNASDGFTGEQRRAYSLGGNFVALLRFNAETRCWQPEKVFLPSTDQ